MARGARRLLGTGEVQQGSESGRAAVKLAAAGAPRGRGRCRRRVRAGRGAVTVLAAAAATAVALPMGAAGVSAQTFSRALANPAANISPTHAMDQACGTGTAPGCQQAVLDAIDAARAAEGVGPLVLPPYYGSLSVAEQLLVLANLERTARGLPGFTGLSAQLDGMALSGADTNNDPNGPNDTSWGSNWAGGEPTALLADFDWMYDDGIGSPNMDCSEEHQAAGCWDHRENILGDYGSHPSIGAAATTVDGVSSMAEILSSGPPGRLAYALPDIAVPSASSAGAGVATGTDGVGYLQTASNGAVFTYGGQGFLGSAAGIHLAKPIVGVEASPGGAGYWEVAADGGVFSFGKARFYGSAALLHMSHRVVGMAVPAGGKGYWLATADGGVYSFGDARFLGAASGHAGNGVVAIVPSPKGAGYWLATRDGAVYSFGDAKFYGPNRRLDLSSPVIGMAATHGGHGYWLVTKAGRVYRFGAAGPYGPALGQLRSSVVGIAAPEKGGGYYLSLRNGTVLAFGGASLAGHRAWHSREAVVGIAAA